MQGNGTNAQMGQVLADEPSAKVDVDAPSLFQRRPTLLFDPLHVFHRILPQDTGVCYSHRGSWS